METSHHGRIFEKKYTIYEGPLPWYSISRKADAMDSGEVKRILFFVESFATGVYSVVRDIACGLPGDSFNVLIVHSIRPDTPPGYTNDFSFQHIQLHYLPMDTPAASVRALGKLRKIIASYQPDVVHLHSSKAGFIGRLAVRDSSRRRVFYSPHGFSFLRRDVGMLKRRIFFLLELAADRIGRGTIIAVSQGELAEALKITSRAQAVNNFIDVSPIPKAGRERSGMPIIATCGRIMPQKNPALFNELALRFPDCRFLWIGDGPVKHELTAPNITVTGFMTRKEAMELVSRALIYVQPSLWEGMPVSVLEAMAAGVPVVASDIIGNRDIINHGKTGLLCRPGDLSTFAEAVGELLGHRELRETIGSQAREYVMKYHDYQSALLKYQELYLT